MLAQYDLTQDPFSIVPDGPVENWAGRSELREDLMDLIRGVRATDIGSTEFLVLWGELGAGKSHALRYLKTQIERPEGEFSSLAVYIERPRVATKLDFLELYKFVVREIGRLRLHAFCERLRTEVEVLVVEKAVSVGMGTVADKSSFRQAVIAEFSGNDRPMIQLLLRGAADVDEVFNFLNGGISLGGGYEGRIDSDFMAAKVLADLFRVLTMEIRPQTRVVESVYLFIDECEMLLDVKASQSEVVFGGLRELLNNLPFCFGLLLSFSAATSLIEAYMPQYLMKRMTHPFIEIPMLEDAEAVAFLRERINFFRPIGSAHLGDLYPFSQEAIEYIINNQSTMTPRNLFRDCKRVMERAIRRHGLTPGDEISVALATSILSSHSF